MADRRCQLISVACAIFAAIALILIAANIAPFDDRVCPWQFPKFASCILSARETLVAGLVAAGGALFAAWLAWSAVRDQIALEVARDAAQREKEARERRDRAGQERFAMQLAADQFGKFVAEFRGVDASSLWTYVDDLRRLSDKGELAFYFPPLPPLLGAKVSALSRKISEQAAKIKNVDTDPTLRARDAPGQITSAVHNAYIALDAAIKGTIDECVAVINELNLATVDRDKIWAG
jgi:hypothetical protein